MPSLSLTAELIELRLKALEPGPELIFDVLAAYGLPKSSITRLRSGDLNKAKVQGSILWKGKLYYTEVMPALLHDTAAAVQQDEKLLRFKPRFIIVSDGSRWIAKDTKTEQGRIIQLAELYKQHDFFLPWAGIEKAAAMLDSPADIRAAQRMGKLFDILRRDNPDVSGHDLNVFLARLLFCLFAEDSGIFDKSHIFTELVAGTSRDDGSDLQGILERVFRVMNLPMDAAERQELPDIYRQFPYVNGGLFARASAVPAFSPKSRAAIVEAGNLDWSEINTDIFGNMFQACLDPAKRQVLGEHYTSVPNIMKVLRPLFLEELENAAESAKGDERAVNKLIDRMTNMRFFDPACGSANFLLIAFKEMRRLEMELLDSISTSRGLLFVPRVTISQFYGIEIDDFAHEIAMLSMWLADHQMNDEFAERFGVRVPTLPLKKNENIILGNALRMDWEKVCPKEDMSAAPVFTMNELLADAYERKKFEVYVFGNPPYGGKQVQAPSQKEDLQLVFEGWKRVGCLDYIMCWFRKGIEYMKNGSVYSAFVATNSITQGEQVAAFWPYALNLGVEIVFAYASFKWENNAKHNAGVTCVIIGLGMSGNGFKKVLFSNGQSRFVRNISPYLSEADDVIICGSERQISSLPLICFGSMPNDGGNLILEPSEYENLVAIYPCLERYIKPYIGSAEFLRGQKRYCLWLNGGNEGDYESIPEVRGRIEACRSYRLSSKRATTRELADSPHLMGEIRYRNTEAIIVPIHSSENRAYVPMGFLDEGNVISNAALAIYDAEPWVFAIISSAMHMAWMRITCGRLETRYRYSAKLCYNTFPIRKLKAAEKEMLNEAAYEVLDIRQKHTEMTLGDMYLPDKMPDDLKQAHRRMDELVDSLYRKQPFNTEEERLECLFALYKKMTS